jgi:hypothetical protein
MNAAELVELALDIGDRVDMQWGLFVTVHMALLGAIVYMDQPLHAIEKVVAFLVYVGFSAINLSQMQNQLSLLDAAYTDIHNLATSGFNAELVLRMSAEHVAGRHQFALYAVYLSHSLMMLLVGLSLTFDQALTRAPHKEEVS